MTRPTFSSLPLRPNDPPFSAWGLYGLDDELGTLNLLTEEVVQKASREIQKGLRIGLDLPLNFSARPSHAREQLTHTVQRKDPRLVHDDVLSFNTQISTQWDGFRHYGYQKERKFYNDVPLSDISGINHTPDQPGKGGWYQGPSVTTRLGIQAWCKRGIVGRGVLLDYLSWCEAVGKKYDPLGDHAIDVDDLDACARSQEVQLLSGDILLVRVGWSRTYMHLSHDDKIAFSNNEPTRLVGVASSIKTLRWLWDHEVSACGSDAPGWERWPALGGDGEINGIGKLRLHEVMLNGWGLPIGKTCNSSHSSMRRLTMSGEMFDLETLAIECQRQKRWSFFFSSMPLHVPGGVASPCNAVAVL